MKTHTKPRKPSKVSVRAWLIVPKNPKQHPFVDAYGATRYHAYSSQKMAEREIYFRNIKRSSVKVRPVWIVDAVPKAVALPQRPVAKRKNT